MSYYPEFGRLIDRALMRLDRPPSWLAQRLGVNHSTVSRWLNQGVRPRDPETVVRIADILGLTSERQALLVAAGYGYQEEPTATPSGIEAGEEPTRFPSTHYTLFIGREQELEEIGNRLGDPECRLLTIVGIGGAGKTRLAAQAAAMQEDRFADGVVLEPLISVDSEEQVARAVLRTLGLPQSKGQNTDEVLCKHLRSREMLLVLDNYEHLLPSTDLIVRLLDEAPAVKVLVTSRARLDLQQEYVLPLNGLPVPPLPSAAGGVTIEEEALQQYGAASLFLHCAQRVQPDFHLDLQTSAVVGDICRLLDGLPLGLELAAGWVRAMPLAAIAQEIQRGLDFLAGSAQDLQERHRSLHAVFDHSWRLLSPGEQRVLRRLSVFRDSFDYRAAVSVAGAKPDVLLGLVDHSWLMFSPAERYHFHPLIHQYVEERLAEDAIEAERTRHRHMEHFASVARRWDEEFWTSNQGTVSQAMRPDFANMLAAWRTAEEAGDLDAMYAIWLSFGPMGFRLGERNRLAELCRRAALRLDSWALEHPDRTPEVARILLHLRTSVAGSLVHLGRYEEARTAVTDLLAWHDRVKSILSDPDAELDALYWMLGMIEEAARNHEAAEKAFLTGAAYSHARQSNRERIREGSSLRSLADLNYDRGRYAVAEEYAGRAIAIFDSLGDVRFRSDAQRALARIAYARGEYEQADHLFREILEIRRQLKDRQGIAKNVHLCGDSAAALGRYTEATCCYEETLRCAEEIGMRAGLASAHLGLARVALAQGRYSEAKTRLDQAQSSAGDSWDPDMEGRILCCRGSLSLAGCDLSTAANAFHGALERQPAFGAMIRIEAHAGLARVAVGRIEPVEALQHCLAALRIAGDIDLAPAKLQAIFPVADLLANSGQSKHAAELFALVQNHPAARHALCTRAGERLASLDMAVDQDSARLHDLDAWHNAWLACLEDAQTELAVRGHRIQMSIDPARLPCR